MDATITREGLVRIPAEILTELGARAGDTLDVSVRENTLVLRITKKPQEPNITKETTDEDISTAVDFGQ